MAVLDEEKRKIITSEIESWRRTKLLPEQYCNFLLNLYLDDMNERPKGLVGNTVSKIGQASGKYWLLTFGIFTCICFVALYFSVFPLLLQIAVTGIGTAALVGIGGWLKEKSPVRGLLFVGGGMLFLLGMGMAILKLHGWTDMWGSIIFLSLCAVIWILCGIALEFPLFHWLGWVVVIVIYSRLLSHQMPDPSWLETQVFWIPASLLFLWLCWFMQVRNKSIGVVFFVSALILWIMPEIYSALYQLNVSSIKVLLAIKIALSGSLLFWLRKHWMEWVA
ncbi:MAG: hypothetical protein P0Y55_10545 [Candidatus Cohnella colombiensis]|uniref:Uncharacterized protein n=1 Tax=Candidatus Cohnella colombiensis TaxID=3121368 RepID=A0AA95JEV9_9BACL|nr:MAG: hypothetical protein P0Y55_10545 [Cohnella sp.]